MAAPILMVDGDEVPLHTWCDGYQQTFSRLDGGASSRRLGSGAIYTSERWERWQTTISASGWIPPALAGLRRGAPFELRSCGVFALQPGESLPAGWAERMDFPAVERVFAGVTVRLIYPVLQVVTLAGIRVTSGGASPSWELVCEEA